MYLLHKWKEGLYFIFYGKLRGSVDMCRKIKCMNLEPCFVSLSLFLSSLSVTFLSFFLRCVFFASSIHHCSLSETIHTNFHPRIYSHNSLTFTFTTPLLAERRTHSHVPQPIGHGLGAVHPRRRLLAGGLCGKLHFMIFMKTPRCASACLCA